MAYERKTLLVSRRGKTLRVYLIPLNAIEFNGFGTRGFSKTSWFQYICCNFVTKTIPYLLN